VTVHYNFNNATDVYVYREEELFKVLAHELIHALHVDDPNIPDDVEYPVREYFGKKSKIYINESFTDTLACILNCWCISFIFYHVSAQHIDHYNIFFAFLQRERAYILQKARDVMEYEGYTFLEKGNGITKTPKFVIEKTHVISYYVLKAMNFYHMKTFLDFFASQKYHLQSHVEYVDMMMTHLNNPDVWKHLKKNVKRGTNSLRMSDVDMYPLLKIAKAKVLKTLLLVYSINQSK
jgi:hypothetical protein